MSEARRVTSKRMTKFELSRILQIRAEQIAKDAPIMVNVPENITYPLRIALMELEQNKSPVKIVRKIPGFVEEIWDPAEMILPEVLPRFPDKS